MERLTGKVALILGAASGIGEASARRMVSEGATVVLGDLAVERAEGVAAELGERASAGRYDAMDVASIEALIEDTIAKHGRIDVLFNNAARTDAGWMGNDTTVAEIDLGFFDEMVAVTLRSYFAACKYTIPHMLAQGAGTILQTSSVNGSVGHLSGTSYGIAKAGVDTLTKYVATQYGRSNIRCNSIVVGVVMTEARKRGGGLLTEAARAHVLTPELGEPEDVAGVAAFLASDDAAFVNGQLIHCDGGWLAHQPHVADLAKLRAAAAAQ